MQEYLVNLIWDNEAAVWIATSDDVPGLVLESGSLDALIERVRTAIPDLLEESILEGQPMLVYFKSERRERIYA